MQKQRNKPGKNAESTTTTKNPVHSEEWQNIHSIKEVKALLEINNATIAKYFKFSSTAAFENSSAKKRFESGIIQIFNRTREKFPGV